jgi:hypothetical protein
MFIEPVNDLFIVIEIHERLGRRGSQRDGALKTTLRAVMGNEDVRKEHHPFELDGFDDVLCNLLQDVKCLQVLDRELGFRCLFDNSRTAQNWSAVPG